MAIPHIMPEKKTRLRVSFFWQPRQPSGCRASRWAKPNDSPRPRRANGSSADPQGIAAKAVIPYDKGGKTPVIRSTICTGEQAAGVKDTASGKLEELMLIRDGKDLSGFLRRYQVEESEIKQEW